MSSPYALPVGPTRRADSSTSIPPPEPRSSTVSPGLSSARAVGLPQPRDARTAVSGSMLLSDSSYRSLVIGSTSLPEHGDAPQHALTMPEAARLAAAPYFSLTISLIRTVICNPHICLSEYIYSTH